MMCVAHETACAIHGRHNPRQYHPRSAYSPLSKWGTLKTRGWKSRESEYYGKRKFQNVFLTVLTERIVWKLTQTLLLHKGGLGRDDFLGVLKVNLSRLTQ